MYQLISKTILFFAALLLLQSCSIFKTSVYPRSVNQTAATQLYLSQPQIQQKLQDSYAHWRGTPYGYGRQQIQVAADCSGFTQQVFKQQFAISLPRTTQAQIHIGKKVKLKRAMPGDLIFFDLDNGYGHVGIYLGNNIVMQATSSKGVTKTNLNKEKWWADRVHIVKRVVNAKS